MEEGQTARILAQFKSENGELVGSPFDLPLDTSAEKLQLVCQALVPQVQHAIVCEHNNTKIKKIAVFKTHLVVKNILMVKKHTGGKKNTLVFCLQPISNFAIEMNLPYSQSLCLQEAFIPLNACHFECQGVTTS